MTRIEVDRERCVSTGGCEAVAPKVFEVGDDGVLVVHRPEPGDDELPAVRTAMRTCPTRALSLQE